MKPIETTATATIEFRVKFNLTETEARALKMMTVYGHKPFLEGFYKHLGRAYMEEYEAGIISLFGKIKADLGPQLYKIDQCKKGIHAALNPIKEDV